MGKEAIHSLRTPNHTYQCSVHGMKINILFNCLSSINDHIRLVICVNIQTYKTIRDLSTNPISS